MESLPYSCVRAGFDKLEYKGGITRQFFVGFNYSFQVYDVEEIDDVWQLVW